MLAEALILSKLDYCNVLFHHLPSYMIMRMQKLQNATAGFVLNKFANIHDITALRWLPIIERIESSILKLAFKGLHHRNMPIHMQIRVKTRQANLRNKDDGPIIFAERHGGEFVEDAAKLFNELHAKVRSETNLASLKKFLIDKAVARTLFDKKKQQQQNFILYVAIGRRTM